jgi:hydrogenase maturation protease
VTTRQSRHAVVVGIGNAERGDDGVGLEVARLVEQLHLPEVHVTQVREPVQLLDEFLAADIVVVVDALSSGAPVGTIAVREVDDRPLPEWTGAGGTHAVGLGAVVELARAIGRLPTRLVIVGVEGAAFDAGADMSPPVHVSMEVAANTVAALVQGRR